MAQTYGALCALAEQHGFVMTDELRALLRDVERADARSIMLGADHQGMRVDYSGLLKQARAGLRREPSTAEMLRQLHDHLTELGRRWYAGDTAVVDELLQLYCVEHDAREALRVRAGTSDPAGAETAPVAPQSPEQQGSAPVPDIKAMVDRFLGWRLPEDFGPDCGISFMALGHPNGWPVGTNLFTAVQAEAMFRHAMGLGDTGAVAEEEANTPINTLVKQYEAEDCEFTDMTRMAEVAMQYVDGMEDSHARCLLYKMAQLALNDDHGNSDPIYQVVDGEDPNIWRDVTAAEYDERQPSSRRKVHFAPKAAPKCWCYTCNKDRMEDGFPYVMTRMIVCPSCGNKRCPRATDHNLACTDSNAPGQPGSRYGANLPPIENPL
ncbi:hypothetical protein [Ralstonia holmesii]|uniref:hypothetical protein n=1 Tax=Ralstonia holmesii TaxID=3058602 RepID=UPI0028F4FCEC|nr:hypothetical protein [Ralstonia sp. LMG 32967]CAJ0705893.1 hypothetical protein R11007_04719 [Ralstonia sp. LMG 32967]